MTRSSTLVRAARKSRRLTQQQVADRTKIDQGSVSRVESGRDADYSTVDRLLAGTGHRLYAAPTRRDDAATAAAEIRGLLRVDDRDRALRVLLQLNDDLVSERGLTRGVLGLAEPERVGDPVWDAAIASLVEWRLSEEGVPRPEWVGDASRTLAEPHLLGIDPADPVPPASEVPTEFAARNVMVWRDTFASV